ncbi:VOC family protein [Gordonia hankookensis]|uniref:VOC family protein n=1 Tax=Gordonia hankookensis TaxID=589403 RepID=A0ABR7W983_9ACTN|nr:VOC family protein [Gordonia hankookensis]MBD1318402.1 VOC family protein [Gordonia hankookensis]
MTSDKPAPPTLNALSIVTADMSAALAFYRLCGLDIAAGAEQEPHAEATAGSVRILFDTREVVESFTPQWSEPSGGHRMALAFECASPDQVDSQYARLIEAGHVSQREPFDAFWGQRYAVVLDPDGNPVDFYCPLA